MNSLVFAFLLIFSKVLINQSKNEPLCPVLKNVFFKAAIVSLPFEYQTIQILDRGCIVQMFHLILNQFIGH